MADQQIAKPRTGMVNPATYKMPEVHLGQTVIWYDGGNIADRPFAAIVVGVGSETVSLAIVPAGSHNLMVRDGVRHVGDPNRRAIKIEDAGAWDHTNEAYERQAAHDMIRQMWDALGGESGLAKLKAGK